MGKAMEVLSGFVTAPSTTPTAWTMAAGNSLTVRNASPNSGIFLINLWAANQVAGVLRVRSPQLHDNVQGMRFEVGVSNVKPLFPVGVKQGLQAQDTLIAEQSGSGVTADIESGSLLIYYDDLPGINGRFISASELENSVKSIVSVQNTLSSGTSGGYSGEEAITAETDLLHANTDYALLGMTNIVECCTIRYRGTDFGNLGVGIPGADLSPEITSNFFLHLSKQLNIPCIPVFNSANKDSILLDCLQDEDGGDPIVTTILAELGV